MTYRGLAVLLLVTCASTAMAQISIGIPGTGSSIQVGPQQDQRDNRSYGGGASIRIVDAVYGRNCGGGVNATDDLARSCQGRDYCSYYIDQRRIGTPTPTCGKDYHARYVCRDGGNEQYASANPEAAGHSVVLDCRGR